MLCCNRWDRVLPQCSMQHYVMLNEDQKNRKLNDLLDALDFNQVRSKQVWAARVEMYGCTRATRRRGPGCAHRQQRRWRR